MKCTVRLCLLLLIPILGLPAGARGAIIDTQNPTFPGAFNALGSQTPQTGGPINLTYDNFRLSATRTIIGVEWQGLYVNTSNLGANPPAANATGFNLFFLSNVG